MPHSILSLGAFEYLYCFYCSNSEIILSSCLLNFLFPVLGYSLIPPFHRLNHSKIIHCLLLDCSESHWDSCSRKNPYPPHERSFEISREGGAGVLEATILAGAK